MIVCHGKINIQPINDIVRQLIDQHSGARVFYDFHLTLLYLLKPLCWHKARNGANISKKILFFMLVFTQNNGASSHAHYIITKMYV